MQLSSELNAFRERGELPASLSKRFINALKKDERARLAVRLRSELDTALDAEASEIELVSLCARIVRVRKIRREKGEQQCSK